MFGAYGETSEGVKTLLDTLVKSRLRKLGLTKGTPEAGKESAWVTGYLRRRLSSSVIKSNISCLLERLVQVDEGGGQGGKRRQWAHMEECQISTRCTENNEAAKEVREEREKMQGAQGR